MDTNNKVKLDQKLISSLKSTQENENLSALAALRKADRAEYLPFLIELFRDSKHKEIKNEAFKMLCELKLNDAVPFLIDAISDKENTEIKKELIEACWQNGLKYTHYLPLFVDLVIEEEELIAFEALTVIENMEYLPGEEILGEQVQKIEAALPSVSENKKYFLNAILSFLDQQ